MFHKERAAFVRECVTFYEPILPRPTEAEYRAITEALLDKYPCLKDKGSQYWVGTEHDVLQHLSIGLHTRGVSLRPN